MSRLPVYEVFLRAVFSLFLFSVCAVQCIKKWSVSSMPPQWGHSGSAPLYLKLLALRPFTPSLSLVNIRSRSRFSLYSVRALGSYGSKSCRKPRCCPQSFAHSALILALMTG